MKRTLAITCIITAQAAASPRALREHIDLHWTFDAVDGWTCVAKTEAEGDDVFEELEDVFLPIEDSPAESGGQRHIQPEDGIYSFTGVAPGEPIWIAPQIQQPGLCWPGFNNYQATETFGSYMETDARLSEDDRSIALPWITISLAGVTYQGTGTGVFSIWQEDSVGTPTVWFSTTDNTHPDTYLFEAGSHKHLNWGFGSPGLYRIRLSAAAFLGPGKTDPTGPSASYTVTFAVGPFAQWQAEHFTAAELDDGLICGSDADPDGDGLKNLTEFAFGFDPKDGMRNPAAQGLGLPVFSIVQQGGIYRETITYPRRKAGEQFAPLNYVSQFSTNPALGWSTSSITETTEEFTGDSASLNEVWEKVTASRPVGTSLPPGGFARIKLEE
jgi:surface-anchored protein